MIRDDVFDSVTDDDADEFLRAGGRGRSEPALTVEEELEIASRIKAGDQAARRRLILANLPIVVDIARRYRSFNVPMDDLIQDGNLGLIRASADFDPEAHGCRFSTYASVWIRAFIRRALVANSSMIQVPEATYWRRLAHLAPTETEGSPTEAAGEVDGDAESRTTRRHAPAQIDDSIDPAAVLAGIVDPRRPEQEATEYERRLSLERALRRLSPVEAWVLRERYGLGLRIAGGEGWESPQPQSPRSARHEGASDDRLPDPAASGGSYFHRTYVELHRDCGLSFYRIRQIESTALEKLREAMNR